MFSGPLTIPATAGRRGRPKRRPPAQAALDWLPAQHGSTPSRGVTRAGIAIPPREYHHSAKGGLPLSAQGPAKARRRPTRLALIDPFADWDDRPRKSEATRRDLRLVVLQAGGVWVYEIHRSGTTGPVQAGGLRWWTRANAKDAATRQAELLLAQPTERRPPGPVQPRVKRAGRPVPRSILDGDAPL